MPVLGCQVHISDYSYQTGDKQGERTYRVKVSGFYNNGKLDGHTLRGASARHREAGHFPEGLCRNLVPYSDQIVDVPHVLA